MNETLMKEYVSQIIQKRPRTSFLKLPSALIMDSHKAHLVPGVKVSLSPDLRSGIPLITL